MQLENSINANMFYEKYQNTQWNLDHGIFLSMSNVGTSKQVTMEIKMNPTQFKNPETEDIVVLVQKPNFPLQKGDELSLVG